MSLVPVVVLVAVLAAAWWLAHRWGAPPRQLGDRHDLTPGRPRDGADRVFALGASYKSGS